MAKARRGKHERTVLVLQGGGALGAYQAGVYEALHEHDLVPDWITGTSIGAINGAIIAGNPPEQRLERLHTFWRGLTYHEPLNMLPGDRESARRLGSLGSAMHAIFLGEPGFFMPRLNLLSHCVEQASFYDTAPLKKTLETVVDFDYLNNSSAIRLSVGAVSVTQGEMVYFDTHDQPLDASHIMASGALPPGFPAVRVDGEPYWDGGVYSNTPLARVLDDSPRADTLCFTINLWSQTGPEPATLPEVMAREKDIRYAARFRNEMYHFREKHNMRRAVQALFEALPKDKRQDPDLQALAELGCTTSMNIVRLGRSAQPWELGYKDIDFSWASISGRWKHGFRDGLRVLEYESWLKPMPRHTGVVIHTLTPEEKEAKKA
jgi:NTE family protein